MLDNASYVLLGGLGGAIVAFLLQTLRDGLSARRRLRSAASVMRIEVIENGSIVQAVLNGTQPPYASVVQLKRDLFDSLLAEIAGYIADRELLLFGRYAGGLALAQEIVTATAGGKTLTEDDKNTLLLWLGDQHHVQLVLKFRSARFWQTAWHWRTYRELTADIRRVEDAIGALGSEIGSRGHPQQ